MTALYSDTHPKMEIIQLKLLRQASSFQKLEMLSELNASAHMLALTGLRSLYPQAGKPELQRRLASLLLGEALARKVYGDLKDVT